MTSVLVGETLKAMEYSMRGIEFGDAVIITHKKPRRLPEGIRYAHIEILDDIDRFNYETVYNMGDYINTDFALLVHYDGFVVNPDMWRDEFLDYDYIGSPWPLPKEGDNVTYRDKDGNICRVGNSVSIRSKRLMDLPRKVNIPWTPENGCYNEDGFICCRHKHIFEAEGMSFAPLELAIYFGHEHMIPEIEGKGIRPFVFHKWDGTNAQYPDFRKKHPIRQKLGEFKGFIYNDVLHIG
ncbi:MAG: hypothetical protein K5888_12205 [Lachnospiraceae bacterium]|nr:hypothetical protein [Lachnospiraceae bacterium]